MTNAERFLNAYAQCEKKLAELAEQPKYIPFSQLSMYKNYLYSI